LNRRHDNNPITLFVFYELSSDLNKYLMSYREIKVVCQPVFCKKIVSCPRNNLPNKRRPCHFLKGAMNCNVLVPRYLGSNPRHKLRQMLRCLSSQISGHCAARGSIIRISPFRKQHARPAIERRYFLNEIRPIL
jgi:hypothetical protein